VGLSIVLFLSGSMLLDPHDHEPLFFQFDIPISASLLTVGGIILLSIIVSVAVAWVEKRKGKATPPAGE